MNCALERFSIKCRKSKTKAIETANQKKGKSIEEQMKTKKKTTTTTTKLPKARENAGDQVVIGVSLVSDWMGVAPVPWTNHRAKLSKVN